MSLSIRRGAPGDAALVHSLVKALAAYEKLADEVVATARDFEKAIEAGHVHVLIAEEAGEPCGFALYFHTFSTFLGRRGLYLEDLFVEESRRGRGVGKALLAELAGIAEREGCGRLEWAVLDWNAPSIAFYESLGARAMKEWFVYRLTGAPLRALAAEAR